MILLKTFYITTGLYSRTTLFMNLQRKHVCMYIHIHTEACGKNEEEKKNFFLSM